MLRHDRHFSLRPPGRGRVREGVPAPSMLESFHAKLPTPFAVLGVRTCGEWLTGIEYLPRGVATLAPGNRLAAQVGRPLERRGWRAICAIPSGDTLTYRDIARQIQSAPRPVGGACGANRIPLVIPCHRVVASHGIGGFMHARGGAPIAIKQWLLRHESA